MKPKNTLQNLACKTVVYPLSDISPQFYPPPHSNDTIVSIRRSFWAEREVQGKTAGVFLPWHWAGIPQEKSNSLPLFFSLLIFRTFHLKCFSGSCLFERRRVFCNEIKRNPNLLSLKCYITLGLLELSIFCSWVMNGATVSMLQGCFLYKWKVAWDEGPEPTKIDKSRHSQPNEGKHTIILKNL